MCLIIAGVFFSRKLYKLNILTLGDYFRLRYNRTVEVLTTLCIVASYLGWVSAQIKALGLVFNVARAYDSQVETRVQAMTSLLEPLIIVFMGGGVGFIAFSILMPILQLNTTIR